MQTSGVKALSLAAISPSALMSDLPRSRVLDAGSTEGNGPLQTWHSGRTSQFDQMPVALVNRPTPHSRAWK